MGVLWEVVKGRREHISLFPLHLEGKCMVCVVYLGFI